MKIVNGKRFHQIELTDEQLAVVSEGLMLVPFGRAAPVVDALNKQLNPPPELSAVEKSAVSNLGPHER
jgi:hypothetical protein